MRSKHVVFAVLITIFCAGAVIAAIMGLSEPISTTNTPPKITLTPVSAPPPVEPVPILIETSSTTEQVLATTTISTPTTTPNDTQASTSESIQ